MVKTRRGLVCATIFSSGLATVLLLTSLGTQQWVIAQGELRDGQNLPFSDIKYGLFSGTMHHNFITASFELIPTCIVSENICAYLCLSTSEHRKDQLRQLFRNDEVELTCPAAPNRFRVDINIDDLHRRQNDSEREFINAGLYISTIVFLALSAIFGFVSTALSIWNTVTNPVEVFLSIHGLYIYNSIACAACILTLCLWGALFGLTLVNNIGIAYTITGKMNTMGLAYLGFSYWLILPACLLYTTSIVILYTRQYLISQEPEIVIHATSNDKETGTMMIY